jgi:hypothetical protein
MSIYIIACINLSVVVYTLVGLTLSLIFPIRCSSPNTNSTCKQRPADTGRHKSVHVYMLMYQSHRSRCMMPITVIIMPASDCESHIE